MSGRVTFEEVVSLRARLAAAEQRAADAEARAERLAAAIKAVLDRLAKRILAEIVYCAPENRALAEEVARVAKIQTDLLVAQYGSVAKETT